MGAVSDISCLAVIPPTVDDLSCSLTSVMK